jgi:RHS repeat-associated protein
MKKQIRIISSLIFVIVLILSLSSLTFSQTRPLTDSHTPTALSPGKPAGSYLLSGFETVNLYNGALNFSLPVYQFDGRGETDYSVNLNIKRTWQFRSYTFWTGPGTNSNPTYWYYAHSNFWDGIRNDYHPAILQGRPSRDRSPIGSPDGSCYTLTKLTFTKADGTEVELRDRQTDGNPYFEVGYNRFSRGQIFDDKDNSSMTFVSDTAIEDISCADNGIAVMNGFNVIYPSGYLYLNGGVRYRINNGYVSSIRDRNGNTMSLSASSTTNTSFSILDNLGRSIDVGAFGGWNSSSQIVGDYPLSYPRANGETRTVNVQRTLLENSLRSDYSIKTYRQLFPTATYLANENSTFNDAVVSKFVIPDGRQYTFKYNDYGELARIDLPTGGAIEYDWQGYGDYSETSGYIATTRSVYRRVKERRVYPNGNSGAAWESKTVYEVVTPGTVEVREYANNNGQAVLTSKSRHYFYGNPETTLRNTTYQFYNPFDEGKEYKTELYDENGNLKQITENTYGCQANGSWSRSTNCNLTQTKFTLAETGQVSLKIFAYDQFNNLTDTYEYDYGNGQVGVLKRRTHTDFIIGANYTDSPGVSLRSLPIQTWVSADADGTTKASLTQFEYDNYIPEGGVNPKHALLEPRINVVGHDTANYGTDKIYRGNVTKVTTYGNAQTQSEPISTFANYDILGNVVKTWDAMNHSTMIDYSDRFGNPDNEARSNTAPTQLNGQSTFAFATSVTNTIPFQWKTYTQFDYFTGQAVNSEDINGIISKMIHNDVLDRPTQSVSAIGTAFEQQSNIIYDDSNHRVETKSDLNALNDNLLKSESFYDGLGRTIESRRYEADGNFIAVKSIPFVMVTDPETGILRVGTKSSNPYRPNAGEQPVWTTSLSYPLGSKVITPEGAIVKTDYSGNTVTVTDQAGKKRRSVTNALGQLMRVDEPNDAGLLDVNNAPVQSTNYAYDTLNNLTTVSQGVQTRSFVYDSLSRLKQATNPESGLIQYSYDNNGNLATKTDARQVVTSYGYDVLNRVLTRSYTGEVGYQTPNVTYTYDNLPNAKGKLIKVTTAATATNQLAETRYLAFDNLGRVTSSQQMTDGVTYNPQTYVYNLSGALIEETYPSGRVVKNTLSNDGNLSQVQSKKANDIFKNYANSFNYTAAGAVSSLRLGNGRWENTQFNSRLQPSQIGLGSSATSQNLLKLNFDYGGADNNGNVKSQQITVPTIGSNAGFTATQTYTYDSLNRLKDAKELIGTTQTWKQTFTFDRFGNRRFDEANTTTIPNGCAVAVCNPTIDPATNKLVGYQFDNSGNTKVDANGQTFIYDAENKQVEVRNASNGIVGQYFYDGDGKRIKKVVPSTGETTLFVYDASGKMVAEYSTVLSQTPQVSYLTSDHLGSPRINTDANGQVIARHDYQPFGEEITRASYGADTVRKQFATYERDKETELDFAQARMYANKLGRFTSADPIFMSKDRMFNPQEINLYLYCQNNPLIYIDPTGEYFVGTNGKIVNVTQGKNGIKVGKNASNDLKRYVKILNSAGSQQAISSFMETAKNPTKTNFKISKDKGVYTDPKDKEDTGPLSGYTQPHDKNGKPLDWSTKEKAFDGTPEYIEKDGKLYYKEVTITIFEDTAGDEFRAGNLRTPPDDSITNDQAIILTGSHEFTHENDTDGIKNIRDKKDFNPEENPVKTHQKVYDEIKKYAEDLLNKQKRFR